MKRFIRVYGSGSGWVRHPASDYCIKGKVPKPFTVTTVKSPFLHYLLAKLILVKLLSSTFLAFLNYLQPQYFSAYFTSEVKKTAYKFSLRRVSILSRLFAS